MAKQDVRDALQESGMAWTIITGFTFMHFFLPGLGELRSELQRPPNSVQVFCDGQHRGTKPANHHSPLPKAFAASCHMQTSYLLPHTCFVEEPNDSPKSLKILNCSPSHHCMCPIHLEIQKLPDRKICPKQGKAERMSEIILKRQPSNSPRAPVPACSGQMLAPFSCMKLNFPPCEGSNEIDISRRIPCTRVRFKHETSGINQKPAASPLALRLAHAPSGQLILPYQKMLTEPQAACKTGGDFGTTTRHR